MAEAMAIVVRYVSSAWRITQCLVRALLVTKTMSGEEVARELIATLSITLGIASGHLHARQVFCQWCGDENLKSCVPLCTDVGGFSHALDLSGKKFKTPNLDEFRSPSLPIVPKPELPGRPPLAVPTRKLDGGPGEK